MVHQQYGITGQESTEKLKTRKERGRNQSTLFHLYQMSFRLSNLLADIHLYRLRIPDLFTTDYSFTIRFIDRNFTCTLHIFSQDIPSLSIIGYRRNQIWSLIVNIRSICLSTFIYLPLWIITQINHRSIRVANHYKRLRIPLTLRLSCTFRRCMQHRH